MWRVPRHVRDCKSWHEAHASRFFTPTLRTNPFDSLLSNLAKVSDYKPYGSNIVRVSGTGNGKREGDESVKVE